LNFSNLKVLIKMNPDKRETLRAEAVETSKLMNDK
jgi:hypothetical protein